MKTQDIMDRKVDLKPNSKREDAFEDTLSKFRDRTAHVGIVGMGYVGVPLALAAVEGGYQVTGFDINQARVDTLNSGQSEFCHIPDIRIYDAVQSHRFSATTDFSGLRKVDSIIICVPTPLGPHNEPDLGAVVASAHAIAMHLRAGQLIVLESTIYPGATTEVVKPILEKAGLKSESDFFLAFSPEREDPGNPHFNTRIIPKVIGGDGPKSYALADTMYRNITNETFRVCSLSAAEAVKLTENIFCAVNIALINELKVIYEAMGIDVWEVIEAAKTKPFGFMPFYPGPGLGGHCIPIDPFYLTWKAKEVGIATRFIELAEQINAQMPHYVVNRVVNRVAQTVDKFHGKGLSRSKILIVGVTYKPDIDDVRNSPSLKLMELLIKRGAQVHFHDPLIPIIPPSHQHPEFDGWSGVPLRDLHIYDAVVIATDHKSVDYDYLAAYATLIVDTRNIMAKRGHSCDRIVKV